MRQAVKKYINKHKHNRMLVMLFSCAIFFGLLFGYKLFGKVMMNHYFNNMPIPAETITSAEVKQYDWISTVSAVGTVQAINSVDVTTESPGVVETIKFNSGDNVNAGDILLELNTKVDNAQLAASLAAMKLAEQDFVRVQQLFKASTVSKAELDSKQSIAEQAIAKVAVQKELVRQKQIHAPFTGKLGIRKVNIGEYVAPGRSIVNLQSLDPIYVNFAIPEQDLYNLQLGLEVSVQVTALQDTVFIGKITAIEPGADPTTRNFNVQATFDNKELKLRSGMFADVIVKLPGNAKIVAIPRSAISYNPYGNSVYVVQALDAEKTEKKDKNVVPVFSVKRRFIKLGRNQGEMVEVLSGLSLNDVVATSGLLKLRNDARVTINNTITPSVEAE